MHVYGLHCRVVTPVAPVARLSDVSLFCSRRAALLCTPAPQVALFLNLLNSDTGPTFSCQYTSRSACLFNLVRIFRRRNKREPTFAPYPEPLNSV